MKFLKALYYIFLLYCVFFIVIGFVCYIYLYNPLFLSIILILILLFVIFDERFSKQRKILFVMISIIQLLLLFFLDLIPILLLKDLFWFSLILNLSFIWHVLILHTLFVIVNNLIVDSKIKSYISFIITRISLITSLTFVQLILSEILLFVDLSNDYFIILRNENYWVRSDNNTSYYQFFLTEFFLFLKIFLLILLNINNYFINIFNNYCLLLLGKNKSISEEYWDFIALSFTILLILSILTNMPRLYLLWFILILYYCYSNFKSAFIIYNSEFVKKKEDYSKIWNFLLLIYFNLNRFENDACKRSWTIIYNKDFYLDYYCYIIDFNWNGYVKLNIYDICDIFIYIQNLRAIIYSNYFYLNILGEDLKWDDLKMMDFIIEYDLKISLDEFSRLLYINYDELDKNSFWWDNLEPRILTPHVYINIKWLDFIFKLERGIFYY